LVRPSREPFILFIPFILSLFKENRGTDDRIDRMNRMHG
jgi:hypothetical protein